MLEGEKNLIEGAKRGEAASFGVLYNHYAPSIYRFLYLKINNKAESEDLLHEVFLSAWQNIQGYNHQGLPFSSWLYQIARNRVIDRYRTQKPQIELDKIPEAAIQLVTQTEELIDQEIALDKVKKALSQLNEEQQTIIILRFVNDLSPSEIAAALSKSEGAIRLMQHRAIINLKRIIQNES